MDHSKIIENIELDFEESSRSMIYGNFNTPQESLTFVDSSAPSTYQ